MTRMDPWSSFDSSSANSRDSANVQTEFEDNFSPPMLQGLPDSQEYLARLEEKLQKIKADPNILRQLQEKREACMQHLLNGFSCLDDDEIIDLDTPVENSSILRAIAPQKQALTQGELVELVKYDQLINEDHTISDEELSKLDTNDKKDNFEVEQ